MSRSWRRPARLPVGVLSLGMCLPTACGVATTLERVPDPPEPDVVDVVDVVDVAEAPGESADVARAMKPIKNVRGLPRVLLIGDSISIRYTVPVRELLDGRVNVHRPLTNCHSTIKGLAEIDAWLTEKERYWHVIHFNFGLHDLKYVDPDGDLADPAAETSRQLVPIEEYESQLREIVARLEETGAALIWCSTTPVPEGAKGRIAGDAARYNAVAAKIMEERGIPIHDLYSFCLPRLGEIQVPANVHFTREGSRVLAEQVADAITTALDMRLGSRRR